MYFWEQAITVFLDGLGLRSIKSKIIVFALFATLLPSVAMGWISYQSNRRAVDEKIAQELDSLTSHASRELELWLQERQYEMRVLSNSDEVSENLASLSRPAGISQAKPLKRLREYLGSVGEKFHDYEELVVADLSGKVRASSRKPAGESASADWLDRRRARRRAIGTLDWDETLDAAVVIVTQPIRTAAGKPLGTMGAKVNLGGIDAILRGYIDDPSDGLYVMTREGEIVIRSPGLHRPFMSAKLPLTVTQSLFSQSSVPTAFEDPDGAEVLGSLQEVPDVGWGVVAVVDSAMAYAAMDRLRNTTLAVVGGVALLTGLAAYLLGLTIVRPLSRLTRGATRIAGGDLEVELPHHGHSEVGYLTNVFNEMVERLRALRDENAAINRALRERNDELRAQSMTDSLTGLYNRATLSELLAKEMARSRRHRDPFSIMMIDIDYFKRFNDTYGHPAGDELLKNVAAIFRSLVRSCDTAARYGGEEFMILLTQTGATGALHFAERVREKVSELCARDGAPVTVSIGVATFPENGDTVEAVIHQADAALYRCKRGGRNKVLGAMNVQAQAEVEAEAEADA